MRYVAATIQHFIVACDFHYSMYSVSRDIMLLFALLQIIALNVLCYSKTAVKVWKSEKGGDRAGVSTYTQCNVHEVKQQIFIAI